METVHTPKTITTNWKSLMTYKGERVLAHLIDRSYFPKTQREKIKTKTSDHCSIMVPMGTAKNENKKTNQTKTKQPSRTPINKTPQNLGDTHVFHCFTNLFVRFQTLSKQVITDHLETCRGQSVGNQETAQPP